jgi:hypothetical protein
MTTATNTCSRRHHLDDGVDQQYSVFVAHPKPKLVLFPPVTMMNRSFLTLLLVGLLSSFTGAFIPKTFSRPELRLQAVQKSAGVNAKIAAAFTVAAINLAPLVALAEEDYEYGAVDAPIGIAVGGGVLAILTALLPVVMKGGEEAFEEMKDQSSDSFGKKDNKDVLSANRKK